MFQQENILEVDLNSDQIIILNSDFIYYFIVDYTIDIQHSSVIFDNNFNFLL